MNLFKARQASCHFAIQKTVKKRYQNTTTKISKFHYIGIKIPLYGIKIPPIISNYYQIKYQKVILRAFNKTQLRARTCLYARRRAKRCRFAPKNAFIPRTGAGIAPRQRPPDDAESRKGKKSPYGYSDIILLKKNAPQMICQGAYLHKNFAARTPYIKKRTCTAPKI